VSIKIGWFTSGRGTGSRAMLEHTVSHIKSGDLNCDIKFIFSHREIGEGEGSDSFFQRVSDLNIPLITNSSKKFRASHDGEFEKYREEFDDQILESISQYEVDVCVLAGYLLILSPKLLKKYVFINLHPSLPGGPKGLWQEVIWQTIEQHSKSTGAMIFLVNEELDGGPPLAYAQVNLTDNKFANEWNALNEHPRPILDIKATQGEQFPLFKKIRNAQIQIEAPLLTETLKLIANEDISLKCTKENPKLPVNLTNIMRF
tara:strand:+ start:7229 stop:8005 length:777 start_codon:yes stop_codon:yes gene_type:complete